MASAEVIARLVERGLTIAVAESLTGGLLAAELTATPGASAAVVGGVVAYDTRIKRDVIGVDADLLAERGAVDATVAEQLAERVRTVLAIDGRPADVGISTTGVAGPDEQDGQAVGTVFLGFAIGQRIYSKRLRLAGTREAIRRQTVSEALLELEYALDTHRE